MTTRELIEKLENKNVYRLVWAIMWRWFMIVLAVYGVLFIVIGLIGLLTFGINAL